MKVTMIYFSQTGNTRAVTETMAEAFRERGDITRTISLKKATSLDASSSDLIGIGTPCHSSQAPTPVKAYIETLPSLEKQRVFVYATCGGAPGRVLYELTCRLRNKGAEVIGGLLLRGEVHHPLPAFLGRFQNRPNLDDFARARQFAYTLSEYVSTCRQGTIPGSQYGITKPVGYFYNTIALISTDWFVRFLLPEPKPNADRCDACKWCLYECPMHNITLQPYPVVGSQCIRCYRCLTGCPQKAFDTHWGLGGMVVSFFYNHTFLRLFSDVKAGERIYRA